MLTIEQVKAELGKRDRPLLVGVSDDLIEERMLVNSFYPQPRIYFSDYVKRHPRGIIFPEKYCIRQTVTNPVSFIREGLSTGDQLWVHPDYVNNELMKGFNPDFSPWYVFLIKGSITAINQIIYIAFSKLVRWTFDLAIAKGVSMVEVSTRYMLCSSNNMETGVVLKGDLVALQENYNVYVHLIPEIVFYQLRSSQDPVVDKTKSSVDLSDDPVLDLHPDLLAMFGSSN